jgi:hypothetical protein
MSRPAKKKKEPLKHYRVLGCLLCPKAPDGFVGFECERGSEFIAHMFEAHGVSREKAREARQRMDMHMTGAGFYRRNGTITLDEKEIGIFQAGGPKERVY